MTRSERRGLRIGVTIGLRETNESLWISGIKQNALYLAKLLQGSPHGHEVRLLNTTDVPITDALPWRLTDLPGLAGTALVPGVMVYASPGQPNETYTLVGTGQTCLVIRRMTTFNWPQRK